MTQRPDDVDRLTEKLKELPLIDRADLDAVGVAYASFTPLLSAILDAALVQVPKSERRGRNRQLFEDFVIRYFPAGRGHGDEAFAKALWSFRNASVKERGTGPFVVTHNHPELHGHTKHGRMVLNLQSLIADFREAVDSLGDYLRSTPELRAMARSEVEAREIVPVTINDLGVSLTASYASTITLALSTDAASATGPRLRPSSPS